MLLSDSQIAAEATAVFDGARSQRAVSTDGALA